MKIKQPTPVYSQFNYNDEHIHTFLNINKDNYVSIIPKCGNSTITALNDKNIINKKTLMTD